MTDLILNTEALAAEYVNLIGYNPFEDDASLTAEEVAAILDGSWSEAIDNALINGDEAEAERLMLAQGEAFTARYK